MKKIFTLILLSYLATVSVQAGSLRMVTVSDTSINSSNFTCATGDTIMWVLADTNTKYIEPTVLPLNASSWSCTLTVAQPSCGYVVGKPGTYTYKSKTDADTVGLVGKFKAMGTSIGNGGQVGGTISGIEENVNRYSMAAPNPFKDKIVISLENPGGVITIYNVVGEQIKRIKLENYQTKVDLDLSSVPAGIYFYNISREGAILETKKIVKS